MRAPTRLTCDRARARPKTEAIELLRRECARTRRRAHVVHLSAADGALAILARAKDEQLRLTAETSPALPEVRRRGDPRRRDRSSSARRRSASTRTASSSGRRLREGLVDLVVIRSLAVHARAEEAGSRRLRRGVGRHRVAPARARRVVWTEARARGASIADVARWMSEAPARLAGLVEERRDRSRAATRISSCGVRRLISR